MSVAFAADTQNPIIEQANQLGLSSAYYSFVIVPLSAQPSPDGIVTNRTDSTDDTAQSQSKLAKIMQNNADIVAYQAQHDPISNDHANRHLDQTAHTNTQHDANGQLNVDALRSNDTDNKTISTATNSTTKSSIPKSPAPTKPAPLTDTIAHLPDVPRTPASTLKLVPTFIGLDTLGKDFRWYTHASHTGAVVGETLYGDLVIKGSGDPKLTANDVDRLLYQVRQSGIRHIHGDIVLDDRLFTNVDKDPSDFDGQPFRPYNASPNGLLVNFSTLSITPSRSDDGTAVVTYAPQLSGLGLPTRLPIISARCGSSVEANMGARWRAAGSTTGQTTSQVIDKTAHNPTTLTLSHIASGCLDSTQYLALPDGKRFTQAVVKQAWQAPLAPPPWQSGQGGQGGSLTGDVTFVQADTASTNATKSINPINPPAALPLAVHVSAPLAENIRDINQYSNNVMTEQLLLSTAAYADNPNTAPTTTDYPKALSLINNWWQSHLTSPPPHMDNGSGLCRHCTITANNLAELLQYAYHHPDFDSYANSLGVAGISGTIHGYKYRKPNSPAIARAWIKTGTLDNVTAMAGYVHGLSGQDYAVVGIINTPYVPENLKAANQITEQTANKRTVPAINYRPMLDTMLDWVARQ